MDGKGSLLWFNCISLQAGLETEALGAGRQVRGLLLWSGHEMTGERAVSKTGGDENVDLIEEVLLTPRDWRVDLRSGLEMEAVGWADEGNVRLWSEREAEKDWFEGRWYTQVELCCLQGHGKPTMLAHLLGRRRGILWGWILAPREM